MGNQYQFDQATFIVQFPEFVAAQYQASLPGYWSMANSYILNCDSLMICGADLVLALNLMTAHIAKIFSLIASGKTSVIVTDATEGSVSLTAAPPPTLDGWKWWLGTTEYGKMLWALLEQKAAGGFYFGGLRSAAASQGLRCILMAANKGLDPLIVKRIKQRVASIPDGFAGKFALVGWWPTAYYDDQGYGETPVAYVALIQEKGAPAVGVPARPFIKPAIAAHKAKWVSVFADGLRAVAKGKIGAEDVLEGVGLTAAKDIAANLAEGNFLPLSPITLLLRKWRKQGMLINRTVVEQARAAILAGASVAGVPDQPLHDTGHMQATLTNAVGPEPSSS